MGNRRGRLWKVGLLGTSLAALSAPALPALGSSPSTVTASCDWPMYGHDPSRTMSTGCAQAPSTSSVIRLLPRWHVHTNNVVTAAPSIFGGEVYVGDWSGRFYALDLATGATRWSTVLGANRTDGNADRHTGAYGTITSSAAVATVGDRRLVFVGAGGSLYALDAATDNLPDAQRVYWRHDFDPSHPTSHGEVESSPVVWSDAPGGPVVFVGSDANQDSGYVGEGVWAVRAATGALLWHFNPETYTHHALYGCGNVWSSPALGFDPTNPNADHRAVLYFGTADCPDNSGTPCPPDGSDPYCPPGGQYNYANRWQPYAESITAVSATLGTPIWSYQGHPINSSDDDDYGPSAQLFQLPDGRHVVGEGGKDGLYVVLDRETGKKIWARAETGNGNLQPGFALGGFIGTTAVGSVGRAPRIFGGAAINTPLTYNSNGNPVLQPADTLKRGVPGMQAFSGVNGTNAWSGPEPYTYGSTSAANGVVYIGAIDGVFRALSAANGSVLWAFPLGAPISSGAAIGAGTVVVGAGTSESDVEFKTCAQLPSQLSGPCEQTPLNQTLNPLGDLGSVWAFSTN